MEYSVRSYVLFLKVYSIVEKDLNILFPAVIKKIFDLKLQ